MTVVSSVQPIRLSIEAKLPELGQKQRLVAEFCLANPSKVLFATASDVAAAAGVDPATVVRFAQSLGFRGFPEFRESLQAEYPMLRSATQLIDDEIPHTGSQDLADLNTIVERVRVRGQANFDKTFDGLDPAKIGAVVDAFLSAQRVVVVGAGQSEVLTLQLRRTLQLAGIKVDPIADWFDLVYAVSSFGPTDVLFATSVWHYSTVTVESLASAQAAGAKVILLTDEQFSPAAHHAEIVLYYAPRAVGEYLSPFAGVAILDAMAAVLAARVPDRVKLGMEMQTQIAKKRALSIS